MSWHQLRGLRWAAILGSALALLGVAVLCVLVAALTPWLRGLISERGPAVAVVRIEGIISSGGGDLLSGPGVRPEGVAKRLDELVDDSNVRAVVLRINSPGGGVVASDEIRSAVLKVRRAGKPVVASMGELAASGSYYIAAASDRILANPQTTTGSIGVIAVVPVVEGLLERIGVEVEIIRSGPLKGSASGFARLREDERAIIQELVDHAYQQFVVVVAEGRGMDRARVLELADGRVYNGLQAVGLGLVDEIGDLPEAIDRAAALAHLSGKPRIIEDRRPSIIEELLSFRAVGRPFPGVALGAAGDPTAPLQYLYLGTGR